MRRRSVLAGAGLSLGAATAGNALVGKDALRWFRSLRAPRGQLPMPGFIAVAAVYYMIMGTVLARALDRGDRRTLGWGVTTLVSAEAWNGLLFGLRSPRAAFAGLVVFLLPLAELQRAVWRDPVSRWALLPYTTYVVTYDLWWAYRLWRLNPEGRPESMPTG